jgi:hypothetical protein
MSRRLVAAGVALVLLALVGGGAFGGVFAADTTGSGLAIDAATGPNGDYADLSNDRITLDLSEGGGVSNDAVTKVDAVFVVTNDRSYAAPVWINDNSSALGFYDTETGSPVDSRHTARNLSAGETLRVGVTVDMRSASVEDVESTGGFVVETLVEDATTATDTAGGTDAPADSGTATGTDTAGTTATATATDSDSGRDGGYSGGGQRSGTTESSHSVYDTDDGATVRVQEAVSSDPFSAGLTSDTDDAYAAGAGTNVTAFAADLTFDRANWRVEVTDPTAGPQTAPSVDGDAVSYFRVDAYDVEASAFDRIGVNATVSLPDGADAADVAFYRNSSDGWQRVATTHHGGERFGADLGGFGEIAVVIESGGMDGSNGDTDGGTDGTDRSTGGTDDTPTPAGSGSGSTDATATPDGNESADPIVTGTATAVERLQEPLALHTGLGGATVFVFGLFTLWLAARGRVGGGNGGL